MQGYRLFALFADAAAADATVGYDVVEVERKDGLTRASISLSYSGTKQDEFLYTRGAMLASLWLILAFFIFLVDFNNALLMLRERSAVCTKKNANFSLSM